MTECATYDTHWPTDSAMVSATHPTQMLTCQCLIHVLLHNIIDVQRLTAAHCLSL